MSNIDGARFGKLFGAAIAALFGIVMAFAATTGAFNERPPASVTPPIPIQPTPPEPEKPSRPVSAGDAQAVAELVKIDGLARQIDRLRSRLPGNGAGDLDAVRQCAPLMRDGQKRSNALREQSESMPDPLRVHVGVAAAELFQCLACASGESYEDACHQAREQIVFAKTEIGKSRSRRR